MNLRTRLKLIGITGIVMILIMLAVGIADDLASRKLVVVDAFAQRSNTLMFTPEESVSDNAGETININTASAQELASFLPEIGTVKAERIVEYRELIGGFKAVDELIEIEGIGEKTLEKLRPYCRVSD